MVGRRSELAVVEGGSPPRRRSWSVLSGQATEPRRDVASGVVVDLLPDVPTHQPGPLDGWLSEPAALREVSEAVSREGLVLNDIPSLLVQLTLAGCKTAARRLDSRLPIATVLDRVPVLSVTHGG